MFEQCLSCDEVQVPLAEYVGSGIISKCLSCDEVQVPLADYVGSGIISKCLSCDEVQVPLADYVGSGGVWDFKQSIITICVVLLCPTQWEMGNSSMIRSGRLWVIVSIVVSEFLFWCTVDWLLTADFGGTTPETSEI